MMEMVLDVDTILEKVKEIRG